MTESSRWKGQKNKKVPWPYEMINSVQRHLLVIPREREEEKKNKKKKDRPEKM